MAQTNEAVGDRFKPFHYDWSNNVLINVTDTAAQRPNDRLRLAYFKAPKTEKGEFRLFWVTHNHDLSKAYIGNASSDLVVTDQGGLASRSSFLKWNREKQQYICLVN
jgi:hypothetical protein